MKLMKVDLTVKNIRKIRGTYRLTSLQSSAWTQIVRLISHGCRWHIVKLILCLDLDLASISDIVDTLWIVDAFISSDACE